jgi:hypothetical protein
MSFAVFAKKMNYAQMGFLPACRKFLSPLCLQNSCQAHAESLTHPLFGEQIRFSLE